MNRLQPALQRIPAARSIATAAALCAAVSGQTAEIATGNPELYVRFDNTIKYNYGYRVTSQDPALLKSANVDDGDRNFNIGPVSNRIDILSELDLIYQNHVGMRVSASAWNDAAYSQLDNSNATSSNHLGADGKPALGLSPYASRYHKGLSGEVLDAFVFARFHAAGKPLNVRLGQFTQYWGESLLSPIHGVNYGQSALDLIKGYSVPGTDAKELFLPRQAISAQFAPAPELALAAQYFFNWKPARLPESGSFLGFADNGFQGGESFNLAVLNLPNALRAPDITPKNRGDFGLSARWSPDWLDATAGLYLRRTSDVMPQVNMRLAGVPSALFAQGNPKLATSAQAAAAAVIAAGGSSAAAQAAAAQAGAAAATAIGNGVCSSAIPGSTVINNNCLFYPGTLGSTSRYQFEYASGIDVLGFSLSKNLDGISVGADLSYRRNMPINSTPALLMPLGTSPLLLASLNTTLKGALVAEAVNTPGTGETSGARGNTIHGVLNFLGTTASTALFDASSWTVELTWNRLDKLTQGAELSKSRESYTGIDKVSKDYFGLAMNYTPTWYQLLPGMDLTLPLNYAVGLSGNSAVQSGGNKNAGNYSAGLGFDLYQKYRFDLKYVGYFGALATDPVTGAVISGAGATALLKDRGFIALTFKTTF